MSRLLAASLAALTVLPAVAGAQATATPPAAAPPAATPGALAPTPPTGATPDLDPATRELVRREVEKAKQEMRDEMRAEVQGAQSAREFMETTAVGEKTKLDFLQLNGYLRLRGDLFDNLDLHRASDPSGYYLFPRPLVSPDTRGTLTSGNLRFRLEPTLNVSEQVRVLSQIDMLDNVVFGSTPQGAFARTDGVQFPFDSRGQVPPANGVNADRNSIEVKRAWAEVQTPVGLLSFGRMPSSWGVGILSHAGNGIDDDLGDTVDRVQFALTPLKTPIGSLVLVPMYEIISSGIGSYDLFHNRGIGQPFDRDPIDDAKAFGLQVLRVDTDEEIKRKFDKGEGSFNYGAWYQYKSMGYQFPAAAASNTVPSAGLPNDSGVAAVGPGVKRDGSAHVIDFWLRHLTKRFRFEAELVGVIGQINNVSADPNVPIGPVLLRQLGGVAQGEVKLLDGKLSLAGELGFASGDSNPGLGNQPGRNSNPRAGDVEGAQYHCDAPGTPGGTCDPVLDVRNFRFNPAYRVDLVLWREILQGVTDAWYLKPSARYEILDGLAAQLAVVYSQAMFASSTPSTVNKPLGLELDVGVSYRSDDGFIAWLSYGLMQPLSGFDYPPGTVVIGKEITRAHAIRSGLAVKF